MEEAVDRWKVAKILLEPGEYVPTHLPPPLAEPLTREEVEEAMPDLEWCHEVEDEVEWEERGFSQTPYSNEELEELEAWQDFCENYAQKRKISCSRAKKRLRLYWFTFRKEYAQKKRDRIKGADDE